MLFWIELIREKKKLIGLLAMGVAVLGTMLGIYFWMQPSEEDFTGISLTEVSSTQTTSTNTVTEILIDIKGEVTKPGVYTLSAGARMFELIDSAGGFTAVANQKAINLASELTDQQMVYVPNIEETVVEEEGLGQGSAAGSEITDGKININTADVTQLQGLSGIGAKKAQAIIDYREENGLFKTVDELTSVSGIGEKTVEKLRDSIRI